MKRLIIAGLIFLLILGLCIGAGIVSDRHFETLKEKVSQCEAEYTKGNTSTALTLSRELKDTWIKTEDYLSTVMNHGRIDDIRVHLSRLVAFIEADNLAGFKSEAAELITLIDQLEEDEKITLHSLF